MSRRLLYGAVFYALVLCLGVLLGSVSVVSDQDTTDNDLLAAS